MISFMAEKSILFIHHGTIMGGAPVSLSLQVKGIINGSNIQCRIACNNEKMQKFFSKKEINSTPWHYTCNYLGKVLIRWSNVNNLKGLYLLLRDCFLFPGSIMLQVFALKKSKERIVHLNSAVLFSSAIAAKITGKKIVWHIREASHIPKTVASVIYYFSDRIVCISPVEASRFGEKREKITVVYNPVNFDQFNPDKYSRLYIRRELGIPENANVVVTLGGVNPRKGTAEIISGIKKCDTEVFAIIVGPELQQKSNNPYHKKISEMCQGETKSKVIFTGIVENPAPYIIASDVLTFIGKTPHFPRPVFEAWAAKTPVIVNEMEGISNNIDHGMNGFVISEPIDDTLAENLDLLFNNHDLLDKMGAEGYKKAVEYTSPEKSAKKLESIFQEIFSSLGVQDS